MSSFALTSLQAFHVWLRSIRSEDNSSAVDICFAWQKAFKLPFALCNHLLSRQSSLSRRVTSLATDILHPRSTPEADWTFQSCKKLASYVNSWRPSDEFDYRAFLLSPNPAPAELYLTLPPFANAMEETRLVSLHPDISYAPFNSPSPCAFADLPFLQR